VTATLIDDVPKAVLAAVLALLVILWLWARGDRRSRAATVLRVAWANPVTRRWVWVALAILLFTVVTEDVLLGERDELVLRLDERAHAVLAGIAGRPLCRRTASVVSALTGEGLAAATGAVVVGLTLRRRRLEALIVAAGTAGAWALSGALKPLLSVARPRAHTPVNLFSDYGFPSGHAVVTVVACGLACWALGRSATRAQQRVLFALTAAAALLAGGSRMVLNAHWLSDVVAGWMFGAVWLNVVIVIGTALMDRTSSTPPLGQWESPRPV
jgi:undecaprenyl-diphosphatase